MNLFTAIGITYHQALDSKTIAGSIYEKYDNQFVWKQENSYFPEQKSFPFPAKEPLLPLDPFPISSKPIPFGDIPVYSSKNIPPCTGKLGWIGQMVDWSQRDDDSALIAPLPKIENSHTHIFRTPGEQRKDICILGSNGIATHLHDSIKHAEYIASLAGGVSVEWLHNHSNGFIVDGLEYGVLNVQGTCPNTKKLFQERCAAFDQVNQDNPRAKMFIILHSQACMQQKIAIQEMSKNLQQRLIVITIGASAVIPQAICYRSFNYASEKDIVHNLEFISKSIYDLDRGKQAFEEHDELILLPAHEGATGIDHNFETKTSEDIIYKNIGKYLNGEF